MAVNNAGKVQGLVEQIEVYGKESLEEILHLLIEGIQSLRGVGRCRVYLEDLTAGTLSCMAAAGGEVGRVQEKSFPINNTGHFVSQVYQQREELAIDDLSLYPEDLPINTGTRQAGASYLLPLIHHNRSIGVICLDRGRPSQFPKDDSQK